MQGNATTRSHAQGCGDGEFWDVISTLTQDLTKARNQLVRLMNQANPGGGRLYVGDGGSPPYNPVRSYTPCAGSNVRNRHRTPPAGHFGCGKQYPHYKSPSPEPRRCWRPVTAFDASPFGLPKQRAPFACGRPQQGTLFGCGRSQQRVAYGCERPQEKIQNSCEKPQVPNYCERQQQCDRSIRRDANCVKICFDSAAAPRRCVSATSTCRGSNPARLQGGGRRHECIGTQFAALLQDVTCQLRERRLAAGVSRFC